MDDKQKELERFEQELLAAMKSEEKAPETSAAPKKRSLGDARSMLELQLLMKDIPAEGWELLDVGQKTIDLICAKLEECKTLVWNGPRSITSPATRCCRPLRWKAPSSTARRSSPVLPRMRTQKRSPT